jgi:hypothetical protein
VLSQGSEYPSMYDQSEAVHIEEARFTSKPALDPVHVANKL